MTDSLLKSNNVIFHEMMAHPVIFSHPHPKTTALVGDEDNSILSEVIKHPDLKQIYQFKNNNAAKLLTDSRVHEHEHHEWAFHIEPNSLDVIIALTESDQESLGKYYQALHHDGVFIQPSSSPFNPLPLKTLVTHLKEIGFQDFHILSFPQPSYPSGWRTAVIALKQGVFKRLREKMIYNKTFKTHYYNFDIHRASMVLPEFMREEVIPI